MEGLTRGRGMTESQRGSWTLSMPICAAVNERMHEITELTYYTSEQLFESSESRLKRDTRDKEVVIEFLKPLESLSEHCEL